MNRQPRRVLLLSESFGAGHTQAAYALAASVRQADPTITTRVFELGKFMNPRIAPLLINAYKRVVSQQPSVVGYLYKKSYRSRFNRLSQYALHRIFYTQIQQLVNRLNPLLIVCTHPSTSAIISRLKRLGLKVPLLTIITDYDAHGTWESKEVDHYFVASTSVRDLFVQRNIDPQRIHVTGIPVHPTFWSVLDAAQRETFTTQLGLSLHKPIVLVMSGGWGTSANEAIFNKILTYRDDFQFVFCTGTNESLRRQLLLRSEYTHPNVKVLGFTNEIGALMDIASLLVTKPGGMTCTEALCKALPMLFYDPIPGQEDRNCAFFTKHQFGAKIEHMEHIDAHLQRLKDRDLYAHYRAKLIAIRDQLYDPTAATQVVLDLVNSLPVQHVHARS